MSFGALGGLLAVSYLIVRNPAYIVLTAIGYMAMTAMATWGVPFV